MQNHPLFPPEGDDDDAPEVEGIHVARFGEGGSKWCAYLFAPEELTELQQVYELFGGGNYELIARAGGRLSAKRRYSIDGRQKPLVYGQTANEPPPVAPATPVAPMPQAMGDTALVLQMMQQMQQSNQQMMLAVMNNTTAMATAMLSRDSDSNKTTLQAMQQIQQQAMNQQAQFFQAVIQTKGGSGGDVLKGFREGLDLGKELGGAGGGSDDDEEDGVGDTIVQVMQGMKMVGQMTADDAAEVAEVAQ